MTAIHFVRKEKPEELAIAGSCCCVPCLLGEPLGSLFAGQESLESLPAKSRKVRHDRALDPECLRWKPYALPNR